MSMITIIIIGAAVLGIIVGSFLNVVIFRMGTGRGIGGRSMCLSCNRTLYWHELIPVISFLIQGGKCKKCKSKISWQYPLVELVTGILFAGTVLCLPFATSYWPLATILQVLISFVLVSIGMVIAVYDIRHKIIHLPALGAFFVFGIVLVVVQAFFAGTPMGLFDLLIALRDGIVVALPFFLLWTISRGEWIGFGDIEIMAMAGLLLGLSGGYSAVFLGFWIACLAVLPVYFYFNIKKRTMQHQIPLGPFLLIGMYLVMFLKWDVFVFIQRVIQ